MYFLVIAVLVFQTCHARKQDIFFSGTPCNYGKGRLVSLDLKKKGDLSMIRLCLEHNTNRPFWTQHVIMHNTLQPESHTEHSYKTIFFDFSNKKLFKKSSEYEYAQLTPADDFITPYGKKMTYYKENTVPVRTKSIKELKIIEHILRNLTEEEGLGVLKIISGVSASSVGSDGYLTYPEFFYKIVITEDGEKYAFVLQNRAANYLYLVMKSEPCNWTGEWKEWKYNDQLLHYFGLEESDMEFESALKNIKELRRQ